ncbi:MULTISPECIES: DUF6968 family protein [Sorangium]|uniref:DUF6968 domain-containing protein n=1 Tax=Sorangium cellulosum TaxID=56 RepID=A0A4P2QYR8_SORCE|nr:MULTISPECIES: hypothetical protein [Sorangium]AUX35448.1 uncharacterized protein SOCE836_076400 [Sorangium cellulosum]WCQ94752.1 hypothetical protein NQZ70_07521 [Sorangium sp. Soce836]
MPKKRIGEPIAVRRYGVEGQPDREIVLVIGKPIAPGTSQGDWCCPVLISGLGDEVFHFQEGVDALQALQLAQGFARQTLEASGLPITWAGGEPGDLGLYRPISSPYGLWFQRLAERALDLAIDAVAQIVVEVSRQDPKVREYMARAHAQRE